MQLSYSADGKSCEAHERSGSIHIAAKRRTFYLLSFLLIFPGLPEGDSLQFCNSIQWEPVETDGVIAQSASSIGIIGGSDGPTSIFVGPNSPDTPRGIHSLPLHSCFAKPSAKVEPTISVVMEGVNVKWLDAETFLWGSKI